MEILVKLFLFLDIILSLRLIQFIPHYLKSTKSSKQIQWDIKEYL